MNCLRALVCCAAMAVAQQALAQIAPAALQTGIEACAEDRFSSLACARGIEREALKMAAVDVSRERTTLSIQLSGRVLRLIDVASGSGRETLAFVYLGRAGATPHHVVLRHSLEAYAYLLIDDRSGRSAQLAGYPVPSADGRQFVAASQDLTAGLVPNVVEIWSVTSDGFRRDALFKPEWGPHSATWLDAARVEVSKVCLQPTEQNPTALRPCGTVRIVKDGRRWRMGD